MRFPICPLEKQLCAFSEAAFQEAIARVRREAGFLGTGTSSELLGNVFRWRRFYQASSFYGHRLGTNVSIISDRGGLIDLFTTDSWGVCKNAAGGEESWVRIQRARHEENPVIAFFGGSTVQGVGSRLPEFTIPALVERILLEEHGIQAVCLNHGVAGWSSAEQFHFLIHETAYRPDVCVFYDGWNCCWHYYHGFLLNSGRSDGDAGQAAGPWTRGTSLRHCEHDALNALTFRASSLGRRAVNLAANRLLSWLAAVIGSARLQALLNRCAGAMFPLRLPDVLRHTKDIEVTTEHRDELLRAAVAEYLRIDALTATFCAARGIRFLHYFQPLVATTRKPLTANERMRQSSGKGMRNPEIFSLFAGLLRQSTRRDHFLDLTGALDAIQDDLFVDGGHLNRSGNYHVARRIVEEVLTRGYVAQRSGWRRPPDGMSS